MAEGTPTTTESARTGARCRLCASEHTRIDREYDLTEMTSIWRKSYNVDVTGEIPAQGRVTLWHCSSCDVKFFDPAYSGSGAFYAQLQRIEWYYTPHKWEHAYTLAMIRPGQRVLEVGCGEGSFVERMLAARISAQGTELNIEAVKAARARGLPVDNRMMSDLSRSGEGNFDLVCAFQVLEHVDQPLDFLRECAALVRPGGRVVIGVPNRDSFMQNQYDVFDMPPHHISRFSRTSLEMAGKIAGMSTAQYATEPLANYHADLWLASQIVGLRGGERRPGVPVHPLVRLLARGMNAMGITAWFRGHTQVISYSTGA